MDSHMLCNLPRKLQSASHMLLRIPRGIQIQAQNCANNFFLIYSRKTRTELRALQLGTSWYTCIHIMPRLTCENYGRTFLIKPSIFVTTSFRYVCMYIAKPLQPKFSISRMQFAVLHVYSWILCLSNTVAILRVSLGAPAIMYGRPYGWTARSCTTVAGTPVLRLSEFGVRSNGVCVSLPPELIRYAHATIANYSTTVCPPLPYE
jgi:hypothetical protein